jgi:hypothetical protein
MGIDSKNARRRPAERNLEVAGIIGTSPHRPAARHRGACAGTDGRIPSRIQSWTDCVLREIQHVVVAAMVAGAGAIPSAPRPSADVLAEQISTMEVALRFSSFIGDGAYLSREGSAFRQVLRASRKDVFLALTRHRNPAARLYGACGLQQLRSAEAAAVLQDLSRSSETVTIQAGCGSAQLKLSEVVAKPPGDSVSEFAIICDNLRPRSTQPRVRR